MSLLAPAIIRHSVPLAIFSPNPMKRNKRRLPIPQHEFGFSADAFNLSVETGLDGERLSRERAESDRARRLAEAAQPALLTTNHTNRHE